MKKRPRVLSGAILVASGLMYFRLLLLLALFNSDLSLTLLVPFLVLGLGATVTGWFWSRTGKRARKRGEAHHALTHRNPLQLESAILFALLFVIMAVLTKFVMHHAGPSGLYGLSFLTGLTDIDPFVMSLSQSAGSSTALALASRGIVIASASNNIMKGIYAFLSGKGELRWHAPLFLFALAAATFLVLPFLPGP